MQYFKWNLTRESTGTRKVEMSQIRQLVKSSRNREMFEVVAGEVKVQEMTEMEDRVEMAWKHSITEVKTDDMTHSITGNSSPGTAICFQIPKLNFGRSRVVKKVVMQLHQGSSLVMEAWVLLDSRFGCWRGWSKMQVK